MYVNGGSESARAYQDLESKLQDTGIWRDAPLLKGCTKFTPLPGMKNIMITGGEGFIACWLVRHLVVTYPEYNIISFDKLDYCASLNNTRVLSSYPNFTFVHGDITQPEQVMYALKTYRIDTVLHFAAQSHVDLSFGNSYQFTSTNVYGTHVLLECAKKHGKLKRFIHVSTDEVYGEVDEDGEDLIETSLLAPTNPYAASKAAAEMMVNAYWKSFKLPVIVVRSNNVYGPHQFPEKVIPKFICLLEKKSKLFLHGDGKHTRRYLYAGDAADAFDTILHKGQVGQIYNVGSADEISNLTLCDMLLKEFGHTDAEDLERFVSHTVDRPFNDRRYAVDATKLKELGWSQKTSFEDGLKITVDWYRKYGNSWWGDIENVLVPFPVVEGTRVVKGGEGADGLGVPPGTPEQSLPAAPALEHLDFSLSKTAPSANSGASSDMAAVKKEQKMDEWTAGFSKSRVLSLVFGAVMLLVYTAMVLNFAPDAASAGFPRILQGLRVDVGGKAAQLWGKSAASHHPNLDFSGVGNVTE